MNEAIPNLENRIELINRREPFIQALSRSTFDQARHQAAQGIEPLLPSALSGKYFVVKDLIDTAGVETEGGSAVLRGRIPTRDAIVIERLKQTSAIMLGKTHTHEFAYGITTPKSRNPLDLLRTPGGSSGGSAAAVAAGYCDYSLGTDTIGSIRIPASFCGLVGLRSTIGRTPTRGILPLSWSLDVVGPICRTTREVAELFSVIAGPDDRDVNASTRPVDDCLTHLEDGVKGLVIGIPTNELFTNIAPEVEEAVRSALDALKTAGAIIKNIEIPNLELCGATAFAISLPESADAHHNWYQKSGNLYAADVAPYVELGFTRPAHEYVRALRVRQVIWQSWMKSTEGIDAVLAPTMPFQAPLRDQEQVSLPAGPEPIVPGAIRQNSPASLLGLPAISVPCHTKLNKLPIGLQIIGHPFAEAIVLRIAQTVEFLVDSPKIALDSNIR